MLLTLAIILLAFWLLGVSLSLLGGLIYIFLVVGVVMAIAHFVRMAIR